MSDLGAENILSSWTAPHDLHLSRLGASQLIKNRDSNDQIALKRSMHFAHQVGHALYMALAMFWEILWALILGFFISGVVQAVVSKRQIAKVLGDDRPRTIATACGLGAASSSCSYAAVAIARALFRKGANFTAAIAFELGSTNLVVELGIIM